MRWNKPDKVWDSANPLFKWRFRSCRRRCCLSSLILPGNDGLTVEFYGAFWGLLGSRQLKRSYNHSELSNSQKEAINTLIETKDENKSTLNNGFSTSPFAVERVRQGDRLSAFIYYSIRNVISDEWAREEGRNKYFTARDTTGPGY